MVTRTRLFLLVMLALLVLVALAACGTPAAQPAAQPTTAQPASQPSASAGWCKDTRIVFFPAARRAASLR